MALRLMGVVVLVLAGALPLAAQQRDSSLALVEKIERAHGAEAYRSKEAVQAELTVNFGGQRMIDGEVLFDMPVGRSRIEMKDGPTLVFDGKSAWISPAGADFPMARFHLLTWPYFLAAPFKFADAGAHVEPTGQKQLLGKTYDTARLTFSAGTGDAPDDWYILYVEPDTGRLKAMAYIVTYGKSKSDTPEPHAILYDDFQTIEGVTVPLRWMFHNWSEEKGIHGEARGQATLSNVLFVQPAQDAFSKPADAKEDPLPESGK
jgi:hypothetical protein